LAEFFAAKFHTIGFDLAGHGKSGWLADKTDYSFETSMRHIDGLIDYRGIAQVDWLGTFTGGILGMMFAAREDSPVRRLILNDIGPFVSAAAIEQLVSRIGSDVVLKKFRICNDIF
jgi:pimeloyl-ACP methyl ester carboxylesterase